VRYLGKITNQRIVFRTRPDPNNPGQTQIQFALGAGAQALAIEGVLLNVSIEVDRWTAESLRAQSLPMPNPLPVQALVDTGASQLALDSTIVHSLNLARRGIATCDTAAGRRIAHLYAVSLSFPGTDLRRYDMLRAVEVDLTNQPFKCLIGRETMANWHFHYNGQSGGVSISD